MRQKFIIRAGGARRAGSDEERWVVGVTWTPRRNEVMVRGPRRWQERMRWLLKEFWACARVRADKREQSGRTWMKGIVRGKEAWEAGLRQLQRRFRAKAVRRFGRLCN